MPDGKRTYPRRPSGSADGATNRSERVPAGGRILPVFTVLTVLGLAAAATAAGAQPILRAGPAATTTPGAATPSTSTATPTFAGATPTATTTPAEGTPVVEPPPTPRPLHLPLTYADFDPRAPGPVAAEARGYLQRLDDPARSACFPATHALTTGAEGGRVEAVVFAAVPNDPALELDLYLGQLVRVSGTESIASAACAATHRLLGVEAVEIIEVPPGAAAY